MKAEAGGGGGVAADYSWNPVRHCGAADNAGVVVTAAVLKAVVVGQQRWCLVCLNLGKATQGHLPTLIVF